LASPGSILVSKAKTRPGAGIVIESEQTSQQPQKKGAWGRLAELGPAWIASIGTLIVALTGAGFFAGRVTVQAAAAAPSPKIITKTVTVTASASAPSPSASTANQTPSPSGVTSTAGNGTQVATYSFQLVNGYNAPLGLSAPTQAQIAAGGNYDLYFNGSVAPGSGEQMLSLPNGSTPSYSACTANTLFIQNLQPAQGASFCIVETSGHMAGVTITALGSSPYSITVKVTLWKYVSPDSA
jgi:hypothetical protein